MLAKLYTWLCWTFEQNIQIKIALSVDKVRILIKILAESHMAFDLGDKITRHHSYPWSKSWLSAQYSDDF